MPPPGPLVVSTLPRLKQVWAIPEITLTYWPYGSDARVWDGALVGWSGTGATTALVAIEATTGKERWRIPPPGGEQSRVEFAKGLVLLNGTGGETRAVDIRTGKLRWTAIVCPFYDVLRDNGTTGFVRCRGPDRVTKIDGLVQSTHRTAFLIGFDLADGRILWRRDSRPLEGGGVGGLGTGNPAIGPKQIHLAPGDAIVSLDPRTGTEQRTFKLPATGGAMVVAVEPGGRDLALIVLHGSSELKAIRLSDGHELWSRPNAPWETSVGFSAALEQGHIVQLRKNEFTITDIESGRPISSCQLPRFGGSTPPRRWHMMRGNVITIVAPHSSPPIVVRCGPKGKGASLAVPSPPGEAPIDTWNEPTAHDGTLIFRVAGQLVGYAAFETDAPEREALSPRARIIAILNRANVNPAYVAGSIEGNQALFEELRLVPNFAKELMALATEPGFAERTRALDAATALRIPGIVPLLLAEIFRPAPVPPALTVQRAFQYRSSMKIDPAHYTYRTELWRREDQLVLLAAMNDPTTASRLGPLLMARSTPQGLGWADWNIWGVYRSGLGAWDARTKAERHVHQQSTSPDGGHSELLPASTGRPPTHAAVYRLLARVGGASELARLDELDRATARSDGWATICDADDAIEDKPIERVWVEQWGVCSGITLGNLRVTQARDVVWLRRRLPDGRYSAPAWAADLGGGNCLNRHILQAARPRRGRIAIRVGSDGAFGGTIDPARAFVDRDRDGLPDQTEAAFGTDPKRPDTDGDGIPDGRDPAPLAGPAGDARAEAVGEMLRYATRFLVGGPLVFQGDRTTWSDAADPAGLLLHMPPETALDDETCASQPPLHGPRPKLRRIPVPVVRVESLQVAGEKASGRIIWSRLDGHAGHDLQLRLIGGKWRVIDDKKTQLR